MEAIWPGSGSAVSGNTPYGFYDNDATFQSEAPKFANWCAKRLGYPIMEVELQDSQFYTCFEESISEYSSQVNQVNIKDNLLSLAGQPTSSNFTHKHVVPTFGNQIRIAERYGTEAGVGGTVSWQTGSIAITSGTQTYDINKIFTDTTGSGAIEIKRVFYEASPAVSRYFDPYAGTGGGSINLLDQFGWGDLSPAVTFLMMPIYEDLMRTQAIEFNDQIRKSSYTFEMTNNQIRIFPRPTTNFTLRFQYISKTDRDNPLHAEYSGSVNVVSDFSNAQFDNMEYKFINDPGKQWIRKYGYSLSKELLGMIRSKYGSIPIPGAETTLDGETLRSEASTEKDQLLSQLRETLETTSRRALLEADRDEADFLQEKLRKVPDPIFIG